MKRGDMVIVEFPFVDGSRGKRRPALIVQNDRDNARLANTIVAMISGNTRHSHESTQLLIDPGTADGSPSGLNGVSVVKCCYLFTVRKLDIQRTIGSLSGRLAAAVDVALREALAIR